MISPIKFALIIAAASTALLWLVITVVYQNPGGSVPLIEETAQTEVIIQDEAKTHLTFDNINIQLQLPNNWSEISPSDVPLPLDSSLETPVLAFQRNDLSCFLVLTDVDRSNLKQVAFADRVYSPDWQFDGNWYAPRTPETEALQFNGNRYYLGNEFRISNLIRRNPSQFVLFNTDDNVPVSNECNREMNAILDTVGYHYTPVTLDNTAVGVIWAVREFSLDDSRDGAYILYSPQTSDDRFAVFEFPPEARPSDFFTLGGKLFYVTNRHISLPDDVRFDTEIGFVDLFSKESGILSETKSSDSYISSVHIRGKDVYYLMGDSDLSFCLDHGSECRADLYKVNIDTGKRALLAESVLGGTILGYNESGQQLYLFDGWGDAGCVVYRFSTFKEGEERDVSLGKYGGCVQEGGFDEARQAFNSITQIAGYKKQRTDALMIQKGLLSPLEFTEEEDRKLNPYFTFLVNE